MHIPDNSLPRPDQAGESCHPSHAVTEDGRREPHHRFAAAAGERAGVADLRRRIRELERENEILREASDFFTREPDPRRAH